MDRFNSSRLALSVIFACFVATQAASQTINLASYFVELYTTGLSFPTTMCNIGPNEWLVCEKNTGQVERVLNGSMVGVALDLAVSNNSERGLLGITKHPNFASNGFIYLYYSRATVDGGTWLDNRVERFVYSGGSLTFNQTIIIFPSDASQANGANHDGGIIEFGPDGKLYVITGDLNRGRFANPRIEQNTSTVAVAGVGGIHRLNDDGTIPADNPFIGHADPRIQGLFAYGIRNSFGLTFDPFTNRLWITENGPNVYDEVNYCPMGFNSGWLKIMGPDSRNATYSENGNTAYDASQLTVLGGSAYRDPEFSWLAPIGVTAILFARGLKFEEGDRGNVFIGANNTGQLYYFNVNATRDGFILGGSLSDKVADTTTERNMNAIGTGWGVTTDMKIGADGYLYITHFTNGSMYRVRPVSEECGPDLLTLLRGNYVSGDLAATHFADDVRYVASKGIVFGTQDPPIQVQVEATAPVASTLELQFKFEGSVNSVNLQQTIELFNWTTNQFEVMDQRAATLTDSAVDIVEPTNPNRFIRASDRRMRAKISYRATGIVSSSLWQARIDRATFKVQVL